MTSIEHQLRERQQGFNKRIKDLQDRKNQRDLQELVSHGWDEWQIEQNSDERKNEEEQIKFLLNL